MVSIFTGSGSGLERGSGSALAVSGIVGQSSIGRTGEQIFVNAATGNLLISQRDEFLVGRGPDASIARTYNSLGDASGLAAGSWRQSTDRRIAQLIGTVNQAGSTVKRVSADGSVITYSWNGSVYVTTDGGGAHDTLSYAADSWTWTDGSSRIREIYTPDTATAMLTDPAASGASVWLIKQQIDTDNNALTFDYQQDQVTSVTTADGGKIEYLRSGSTVQIRTSYTNLQSTSAKSHVRTTYTYDSLGRLRTVAVDLTPESLTDTSTYVTTYSYDGDSARVRSISQSDGSFVEFDYVLVGGAYRVASVAQAVSTGVVRTTTFGYDVAAGKTTITDAHGQSTVLEYDSAGQLSKIIAPSAAAGAAPQSVEFLYYSNGDLFSARDAAGYWRSYEYDTRGNLLKETDSFAQHVTRTYTPTNQLESETRIGSSRDQAAAPHTTRYVYDAEEHLIFVVSAEGRVTEHRYDVAGERTMTVAYPRHAYVGTYTEAAIKAWRDALPDRSSVQISVHAYDARGNLTYSMAYGAAEANGTSSTTQGFSRKHFVHDESGRLISTHREGQSAAETFLYDGLGRMIGSTDLNGGITRIDFDDAGMKTVVTLANGFVQTSTYDKVGQVVSSTSSGTLVAAETATLHYDKLGRVRISTDASGRRSYFVYDAVGRKVADVTQTGEVTEYRYDSKDRLVATIRRASAASPSILDKLAAADPALAAGDLTLATDADDWSWRIYDREDRLIETIAGDGSVVCLDYDISDRLVRTTRYANKLTTTQITALQAALPSAPLLPTGSVDDSVSRSFYDRDGRLIGALDGAGYLTVTEYDGAGQVTKVTAYANSTAPKTATDPDYRHDGTLSQLLSVLATSSSSDRTIRFVYDGQGQLRFELDALGHVTEHSYDFAGHRTGTIRYPDPIAVSSADFDIVRAAVAASGLGADPRTRRDWSVYDQRGRLAYAIDAAGGVTRFFHNDRGRIWKEVRYAVRYESNIPPAVAWLDGWEAGQAAHADNRATRFYYDGADRLCYTLDAEGYVTRNAYDAAGRVVAERRWDASIGALDYALSSVEAAVAGRVFVEKTFAYDQEGRLEEVRDEGNVAHRYVYASDGTLEREIAAAGTAAESVTRYEYDGAGRVVATHAAYGTLYAAVTRYEYDGLGNLVKIIDPRQNATTRTYDRLGRLVSETDALSGVVRYEYNGFGEAAKVTDARSNVTYRHHDRLGRLTHVRDAEDYVTRTDYDGFGDVSAVTRYHSRAYDVPSTAFLPAVADHAGDATTRFEYDRLGRAVRTIDAENGEERYTLNAFGDRILVRNKLGGETINAFDRRGLLVRETLPIDSVGRDGSLKATAVTHKYEYDARGNRTKTIEALGLPEQRSTTYVYDELDRLVETRGEPVQALSQSDHSTLFTETPKERIRYDAAGNVAERTDALGARTLFYYDALGRQAVRIDPLGTYTSYAHDANGNLAETRVYEMPVALPGPSEGPPPPPAGSAFRRTSHGYDKLNRLEATTVAGVRTGAWNGSVYADGTPDAIVRHEYDAAGNLVKTTDAEGGTVQAFFDRAGRKVAQVDQTGHFTAWTLDAEGNVLREDRYADAVAVSASSTAQSLKAAAEAGAGAASRRTTLFAYDRNGRRTGETRLGVAAQTLDAANNLAAGAADAEIRYAYNGFGQVTRKVEANGDTTDYSYDWAGRLRTEKKAGFIDHSAASVRPTVDYSYDALGNLTRTIESGGAPGTERITRYAYDGAGRLAQMWNPEAGEPFPYAYAYDAAGNLLRESYVRERADGTSGEEAVLYTRDALGRVTAQALAAKSGGGWAKGDSQLTAYNVFGEVSARGINGFQEQFRYDAAGRLASTNSGDGVWRFFLHDRNGNRTLTVESEGTDLVTYNHDQVMGAVKIGGSIGGGFLDGFNVSIATFDGRGQQLSTILPHRELRAGAARETLVTSRTYNAFGEVASETDALTNTTEFLYNAMGRLIEKRSPTVFYTSESGVTAEARPTERFHYDVSGRLIGTTDANGNATRRRLLAGTGHGGGEALVTWQYNPDGGSLRTHYDVFGDARIVGDALGRDEVNTYDKLGRLVERTRRAGLLTEHYAYDVLGQRIRHWNSLLGSGNVEATHFDLQGRVTKQVAFGGDQTTTDYIWYGSLATGVGAYGGWMVTTTHANNKSITEHEDIFGRTAFKSDMGANQFGYTYDKAGRLTQQASSNGTLQYEWLNTGLLAAANGGGAHSTYGYDKTGNRISEATTKGGQSLQNASAEYDALGRMTRWAEAGSATAPAASTGWKYDLAGNIRSSVHTYNILDAQGAAGAQLTATHWFRYDPMNRVTVDRGELVDGQVRRGEKGIDYVYDRAGNRRTTTQQVDLDGSRWEYVDASGQRIMPSENGLDGGHWQLMPFTFRGDRREEFDYDAAGRLQSVRIADGWYHPGDEPTSPAATPQGQVMAPTNSLLKASFSYDAMDRQTRQIDWLQNGSAAGYDRQIVYNAKGQVESETAYSANGSETLTSLVTYGYGAAGDYALGAPVTVTSSDTRTKTGPTGSITTTTATVMTTNAYRWFDGAAHQSMTVERTDSSGTTTHTTQYDYNGSAHLNWVQINDGRPRRITFTNDVNGQALRRDEADNYHSAGDPHEVWYRFAGREMGFTGNNSTLDTDYKTSIDRRTAPPKAAWQTGEPPRAFRHDSDLSVAHADFAQSLERVNSWSQGGAGGGYTVRAGDTLAALALGFWGDASLWYKLAEANGLSGASSLYEGQRLAIPAGVMRNTHNASTLRPYDPASAIGDTSPTSPKPQKRNKCGMFGQILLVAIAVAVSAISYGALTTASTGLLGVIAAGGVSGAAGSLVSQGFGVAAGIQQGFSWKGVAMAAIGGAVGGGLGKFAQLAGEAGKMSKELASIGKFLGKGNFGSGLVNGAVGNVLTQGIGVATGMQKKFDFAGVAAAALGGGVGNLAGGWLKAGSLQSNRSLANHLANGGASAASALANAATRSLLSGTSFGDNLIAALPDVIGSTIGNMFVYGVSAPRRASIGASSGLPTLPPASPNGADVHVGARADGAIDPRARGSVTASEAVAAAEGMLAGLPVPEGSRGSRTFGGDQGDRYKIGPGLLTRWIASEGMKADAGRDFDAYVDQEFGGNRDGVSAILHQEVSGPAAGHTANTLTLLAYMAGNGSAHAAPVALGLYSRTDVAAAASVLGGTTNSLIKALDAGIVLAVMHSAQVAQRPHAGSPSSNDWQGGAQGFVSRASYVGIRSEQVRFGPYHQGLGRLGPNDEIGRYELKRLVRNMTPLEVKSALDYIRPNFDATPGSGGTANRSNVYYDRVASRLGALGKGSAVVGAGLAVYDVATSDNKYRSAFANATAAVGGVAGGFVGAIGGGAAGTVVAPGPGTVAGAVGGGIGGSVVGGVVGYRLGERIYDFGAGLLIGY